MTEENYNPDTGETEQTSTIEADRGVPQVAKQSIGRIIGMGTFLICCAIALIAVIYDGINKNQTRAITEPEEITFKTPNTRNEPYIVAEAPPPPPQKHLQETAMPQIDPLQLQREAALREEALRIARERQKELEQRIKSPQLVYDAPTSPSTTTTLQQTHYDGNASLLSGNDSSDKNTSFANTHKNTVVETAQATQLRNLPMLIAQGEMISGILETAIQSDLPGMVRAITSENVYSFNGSNLLIPKGTRLVGQYQSQTKQGQSRVFVIWNRLIRPDGASINLGSIGTDSLGRSGLAGEVDTHFMQRFGSSILLSMIDGGLKALVESSSNSNSSNVSLNGSNDFSRSAEIALEDSIKIKPTIHMDQGARIKIFVGKDLDFSLVGPSAQHSRM